MTDTTCLNDTVTGKLVDLFLYRLPIDKHGKSYGHIRSAVLLTAMETCDVKSSYDAIAEAENTDPSKIASDVRNTISALPVPVDEIFNKYYSVNEIPFMPPHKDPDEIIAFLATVLLYLLETNYRV